MTKAEEKLVEIVLEYYGPGNIQWDLDGRELRDAAREVLIERMAIWSLAQIGSRP